MILSSRAATPARVTLGITTVLTIITLKGHAEENLPHTSYIKVFKFNSDIILHFIFSQAIGLYLWVCFMFTFAALIEYSIAAYLEKRKLILQTAIQGQDIVEKGDSGEDMMSSIDNNIHLAVHGKRERKSSFISKSLNDPKLLEVSFIHRDVNCQAPGPGVG